MKLKIENFVNGRFIILFYRRYLIGQIRKIKTFRYLFKQFTNPKIEFENYIPWL